MTKRDLRIIFMGTPDFAVPSLRGLLEAGHQVRARHRGHRRLLQQAQRVVGPADQPGRGRLARTRVAGEDQVHRGLLDREPLLGTLTLDLSLGDETAELLLDLGQADMLAMHDRYWSQNDNSRLVAFEDLGMEAIYEFEVKDMPVTLAVDSRGESVHREGPKIWSAKIAERIEAVNV